jgi:hypothetical protein
MFIRKGIGFQQTEQSESNMVEKRHFLFPTQEMGAKTPPTPVFVCEHVNGFIYWMGVPFPEGIGTHALSLQPAGGGPPVCVLGTQTSDFIGSQILQVLGRPVSPAQSCIPPSF